MTTMAQFHLAFPVTDLTVAREFYGGILGCPEGRSNDRHVDFDFYGHQIVAHIAPEGPGESVSEFDGEEVPVPHFGLNLDRASWEALAARLRAAAIPFVQEPHVRLAGEVGEHATMFLRDPFGNALEFKAFVDPRQVFVPDDASAVPAHA
jgi:extradiol dioxygenase family protein